MALQKQTESITGATGNYWRVTEIYYVPKVSLSFNAKLYVDKAARDAGKESMEVKSFTLNNTAIEGCAVTFCYNHLKALQEFADAIDC